MLENLSLKAVVDARKNMFVVSAKMTGIGFIGVMIVRELDPFFPLTPLGCAAGGSLVFPVAVGCAFVAHKICTLMNSQNSVMWVAGTFILTGQAALMGGSLLLSPHRFVSYGVIGSALVASLAIDVLLHLWIQRVTNVVINGLANPPQNTFVGFLTNVSDAVG